MKQSNSAWLIIAGILLFVGAGRAYGQTFHKCVDANGDVTFQDSPCPEETDSQRIDVSGSTSATRPLSLDEMIDAGPLDALNQARPILRSASEDAASCLSHVETFRDMQDTACANARRAQAFISDYADYASMIVNREVPYDDAQRPRIDRVGLVNRRIVDEFNASIVAINKLLGEP